MPAYCQRSARTSCCFPMDLDKPKSVPLALMALPTEHEKPSPFGLCQHPALYHFSLTLDLIAVFFPAIPYLLSITFLTVSFASKCISPLVNSLAFFEDLSSHFITCFGCFHFSVTCIWSTHWSFLFSDSHLCLIISLTVSFFMLSSLLDLPNLFQTFVFKVISTFSICFHVLISPSFHYLRGDAHLDSPLLVFR